jgi:hypothetical protein
MNRNTKLEPAPLSGKNHLSMGKKTTTSDKHSAQMDALLAQHKAEIAELTEKHEKELGASKTPIMRPAKVSAGVKRPDLSKYPKGK